MKREVKSTLWWLALLGGALWLSPAPAQWQTPQHSIPVGRGAGTGFTSVAPGTAGIPLTSSGAAATPSFTTCLVVGGCTGITSYAIGDILYASGATTLSKLAGVATGNVLLSGGVTTAPSWGKVALTALATQAANTALVNATGSAATPTAQAMPSCTTTGSALIWTPNTGFGCAAVDTDTICIGTVCINHDDTIAAGVATAGLGRIYLATGTHTVATPVQVELGTCIIGNGSGPGSAISATNPRGVYVSKTASGNVFNVTGMSDDSLALGTCLRDFSIFNSTGSVGVGEGIAINQVATGTARATWTKYQNINIEAVAGQGDWEYGIYIDGTAYGGGNPLIRNVEMENIRIVTGLGSSGGVYLTGVANGYLSNVHVDAVGGGTNGTIEVGAGSQAITIMGSTAQNLKVTGTALNTQVLGGNYGAISTEATADYVSIVSNMSSGAEPTLLGPNNWFNGNVYGVGWLNKGDGSTPHTTKVGSYPFTVSGSKVSTGATGGFTGTIDLVGGTSGTAKLVAQAAAGTPTLTLPTGTGTLVSTATAPLAINSVTGAIACASCPTGAAWSTWVPSISCDTPGTFATGSVVAEYETVGKTTHFSVSWTVTDVGSCAAFMTLTTPSLSRRKAAFYGRNTDASIALAAGTGAGSNSIFITYYNNTNPVALNSYTISGTYQEQ